MLLQQNSGSARNSLLPLKESVTVIYPSLAAKTRLKDRWYLEKRGRHPVGRGSLVLDDRERVPAFRLPAVYGAFQPWRDTKKVWNDNYGIQFTGHYSTLYQKVDNPLPDSDDTFSSGVLRLTGDAMYADEIAEKATALEQAAKKTTKVVTPTGLKLG